MTGMGFYLGDGVEKLIWGWVSVVLECLQYFEIPNGNSLIVESLLA